MKKYWFFLAPGALLAGCHWMAPVPGYGINSWTVPNNPVVGEQFTVRLTGPIDGPKPLRDGDVYEVFINNAESHGWREPTGPDEPRSTDSGVKLGEITTKAGTGTLEITVQPKYGPDKYGTIIHVAPDAALELRVIGRGYSMTRSISISHK